MENLTLPASSTQIDLSDTILSHIQKSKTILTSVMFATEFLRDDMVVNQHTIYHALWAVDDYLEGIEALLNQ
ncbi:MAG: hypothetical protein QM752_05795 [Gammaproteobacteria bacterium]